MCLGKIMGLGLVYSLASAFLGSKTAMALHWIKNRPGRDAVGGFGVSGAVERKTPLRQFFVTRMADWGYAQSFFIGDQKPCSHFIEIEYSMTII
jgi:hypothetical protein